MLKEFPELLTPNFTEVKHKVVHSIPIGDATPRRSKARPLLPNSPKAINGKAAWMQMVEMGIVEKVVADEQNYWSAALHLQTKSDGSERPCGDFRTLNEVTITDAYVLPNLNDFTNQIKDSKVFSRIDMSKAFHYIPIRKEDQLKVCVNTPWGLFVNKFVRMPFGVKNVPAIFQRLSEEVLDGIPGTYVYLDDVLVFNKDRETHPKIVRQIFQRFVDYGLALALPKCHFAANEVEFLGYKPNKNGITPLPNKIQSIQDFPEPKTQKSLLKFLGMLNFYRKTLPNLKKKDKILTPAEVLQGLYTAATLKMPKQQFDSYWVENKLSDTFRDAKQLLLNCCTLMFPNPSNPLAISCDASDKAVGAVLEEFQDGIWKPLGFWSKHLSKPIQN